MTRTNRELKLIFAVIVVLFAVFLAGPILILLGKSLWDGGLTGEFYASVLSQKGFLPAPVSYTHLDVYKRQIHG